MFLPKFKPIIIEKIKARDVVIGEIGAINLKSIDFNKEDDLNNFIKSIEEIKNENCERIFIEGYENLDIKVLNKLKRDVKLFTESGEFNRLTDFTFAIKKIFSILNEDLKNKEVLILCNDFEKAKNMIKQVAKEISFITVYGLDEEVGEELYQFILEEIGLSIFNAKNYHNIIENYNIIINYLDELNLEKLNTKQNSIIFDFTTNKGKSQAIKDYGYDLKDMNIKKSKWLNSVVDTGMIEFVLGESIDNIKPKYVITADNNYYIFEEYIDLFIKIKGKF